VLQRVKTLQTWAVLLCDCLTRNSFMRHFLVAAQVQEGRENSPRAHRESVESVSEFSLHLRSNWQSVESMSEFCLSLSRWESLNSVHFSIISGQIYLILALQTCQTVAYCCIIMPSPIIWWIGGSMFLGSPSSRACICVFIGLSVHFISLDWTEIF